MKSCNGCCCNGRAAAVALLRWALGLVLLFAGLQKSPNVSGFVNGYLVPAFQATFLPVWLLTAYGYALPFVEAILGVLLILGLFRNSALFTAGLTFISLAFGQMLIKGGTTVAVILGYLFMTAVVLFLEEHDRWIIGCCRDEGDRSDES